MAPRIQLPLQLPLAVSPHQQRGYEQLAMSVVQRNVVDLDDLLQRTNHNLPIDIYRSRERVEPDVLSHPYRRDAVGHQGTTQSAQPSRAPLARLLCVGTLEGSLEDAMLGSATPTQLAMATRSLYLQDDFVQHEVLHDIKKPTRDDPFEYLGLKWALRASPFGAIVRERDLVYVEATGFHTLLRKNGQHERIGYIINHSVDLAELPPLVSDGVVRAKFSLFILVRQAAPGVVEVYATIWSYPGGSLPTKLAALSAASTLIAVSRGMDCTLGRTLVWMFKKRLDRHESHSQHVNAASTKSTRGKWWCAECTRELSAYRRRTVCCICQTPVCSRCIHTRRLALGPTAHELAFVPVPVCSGCLATARSLGNARQVAMDDMADLHDRRLSEKLMEVVQRHPLLQSANNEPCTESIDEMQGAPSIQYATRDTRGTITVDDDPTESEEYYCGSQYSSQASSPRSLTSSRTTFEVECQQMLLLMSKLRLQAEETYSATMSMTVSTRDVN